MGFLSEIIGYPLGWIMYLFYNLVENYGISIILFTIVTKLILLPLSINQQKNTVRNQMMSPKQARLQKMYANNKEKYQEELMKLYEEEGVNPTGGCMPMVLQFVLLYGIIDVVYRPLSHIFRASKALLAQATEIARPYIESLGQTWNDYRKELFIMQAVKEQPDLFSSMPELVEDCLGFHNTLFGLNLDAVPQWGNILMIIPILSGLVSLGSTIYSQWHMKKVNPNMQSMGAMNIMFYTMPLISVWIAFTLPAGVGFYWIISGIVSFVQMLILNKVMTEEVVMKMVEKDKEKAKKSGRKSMYQRMLEQQEMLNNGGQTVKRSEKITDSDRLSRSQQKEIEKMVINEARQKQLQKYGESDSDNLTPEEAAALEAARRRMAEKYGD